VQHITTLTQIFKQLRISDGSLSSVDNATSTETCSLVIENTTVPITVFLGHVTPYSFVEKKTNVLKTSVPIFMLSTDLTKRGGAVG
jgi:hypothetical protein